jgi:hypothetical protein
MDQEQDLRKRLDYVLSGKGAHIGFEDVLQNYPENFRGAIHPPIPYSAWQLLEHLRIAQWDILEFSINPDHVSPKWPDGYWPKEPNPPNPDAWNHSVEKFFRDLKNMRDLATNPETDLHKKIPGGSGQNILREALLVADHNAYHLGQLVMLKKILESKNL